MDIYIDELDIAGKKQKEEGLGEGRGLPSPYIPLPIGVHLVCSSIES